MTGYGRVVRLLDRGAEKDDVEEEGGVEDRIGSYTAADKPFDCDVVVDGKDSSEEEEESRFDGERDG